MPYFYLSLMSSRIFHSTDIEGLHQALTEEPPAPSTRRGTPAPRRTTAKP